MDKSGRPVSAVVIDPYLRKHLRQHQVQQQRPTRAELSAGRRTGLAHCTLSKYAAGQPDLGGMGPAAHHHCPLHAPMQVEGVQFMYACCMGLRESGLGCILVSAAHPPTPSMAGPCCCALLGYSPSSLASAQQAASLAPTHPPWACCTHRPTRWGWGRRCRC